MQTRALLFDLDGTLAASESLKGRALADTCAAFGHPVDYRRYADVMGGDWPTVTSHFFRLAGLDVDLATFNERFRPRYQQLLADEACLSPGADALLAAAQAAGVRLAVVSSAARWMVDAVLQRCGVAERFELVISKEDVARHKPDPAAYLLALDKLQLPASAVCVLEDSAAGLAAARAAGCRCLVLRHDFNHSHDFRAADATLHTLADALPLLA